MARVDGSLVPATANVTVKYYRVGGGHRFAVVYAVPNLACSVVLVWLFVSTRFGLEEKRKLAGGDGDDDGAGRGLRLDDLDDLLELGRRLSNRSEVGHSVNSTFAEGEPSPYE